MLSVIKPEMKYVESYWETIDTIAKEKIYLAALEAFPLESTIEFVKWSIENNRTSVLYIRE